TELIFANPDVKFSYSCDGKVVFDTNRGLENSIFEIFGTETANKMLPFDKTSGNIRVYGYIGDRTVYKHNRNYQTTVVNGRTVESATVQTAVSQAYGNRLMTRCYPVFVINIILPFDEVDVNVHPNKKEVRFANSQQIFSKVYHAVEETLADDEKVAVLFDVTAKSTENNENIEKTTEKSCLEKNFDDISQAYIDIADRQGDSRSDLDQTDKNLDLTKKIEKQKSLVDVGNNQYRYTDISALRKVSDNVGVSRNDFENLKQDKLGLCDEEKEDKLKILGQLFDTYLVLEYQNFAYIIDQHACHERYLYDKLKEKIDDGDVSKQPLLVPYILECNPSQFDYVQAISQNLAQIGFEIEEFGGLSYKVYAVPAILYDIDLDDFFADIVSERKVLENAKQSELIKDKLAMTACKAAIKAGDKLSNEQIKTLIANMKNGVPIQCPHGRPALIKLSRTDLDKMFKRIV
ncbi:MAG: DNA mismatch repair endonuclease MutL, partial [Christensenellales bacterium]